MTNFDPDKVDRAGEHTRERKEDAEKRRLLLINTVFVYSFVIRQECYSQPDRNQGVCCCVVENLLVDINKINATNGARKIFMK